MEDLPRHYPSCRRAVKCATVVIPEKEEKRLINGT
ncbi:hypothetical protein M2360_004369 [Rhizobium sp. SG_E_25_P2]|nr:hypothetical protein [Rhizobium sp. SG_E_25_P2]